MTETKDTGMFSPRPLAAILTRDIRLHTGDSYPEGTKGLAVRKSQTSYSFTVLHDGKNFLVLNTEIKVGVG